MALLTPVVAAVLGYVLWRLARWATAPPSALARVAGPPRESWLKGASHAAHASDSSYMEEQATCRIYFETRSSIISGSRESMARQCACTVSTV